MAKHTGLGGKLPQKRRGPDGRGGIPQQFATKKDRSVPVQKTAGRSATVSNKGLNQ